MATAAHLEQTEYLSNCGGFVRRRDSQKAFRLIRTPHDGWKLHHQLREVLRTGINQLTDHLYADFGFGYGHFPTPGEPTLEIPRGSIVRKLDSNTASLKLCNEEDEIILTLVCVGVDARFHTVADSVTRHSAAHPLSLVR